MSRILVGIDGSENSTRAAMKAAEMALFFKGKVTLIHVLSQSESSIYARNRMTVADDEIKGMDRLKDAIKVMDDFKVMYETKIVIGNPAEAILLAAETEDESSGFDLIVLGSRGANAIERFLTGSVSQRVVQHSKLPVLVVP